MDGGPALQMPMPQNMLESEMIGAIKIKDGLFIGDELASTVSCLPPPASLNTLFALANSIRKHHQLSLGQAGH